MTESHTLGVLKVARKLYAQAPSHAAIDVEPESGKVCVLSATERAADIVGVRDRGRHADIVLRRVVGEDDLISWNAESSTETVLLAFDRAIEQLL